MIGDVRTLSSTLRPPGSAQQGESAPTSLWLAGALPFVLRGNRRNEEALYDRDHLRLRQRFVEGFGG